MPDVVVELLLELDELVLPLDPPDAPDPDASLAQPPAARVTASAAPAPISSQRRLFIF